MLILHVQDYFRMGSTLAQAIILPDSAVKHLAEVRDISLEEAEKRIGWQARAMELSVYLEQSLQPDRYGGVWIGGDDRVKIGLKGARAQQIASQAGIDSRVTAVKLQEAVDYVPVGYSLAELQAGTKWIAKSFEPLDKESKWPIWVGVKTNTNQIILSLPPADVGLPDSQQRVLAAAQAKYGSSLRIERFTDKPRDDNCNLEYCDSPLRGGVAIAGSNNYDQALCTLGFIVRGNSGQLYALTAGHCESEGGNGWATRNSSGLGTLKKIGPVHRNVYPSDGQHDAMIVKIDSIYNWTARGWVYIREGQGVGGYHGPSRNTRYDITGTSNSSGLVGQRVCASGFASGSSCGPVRKVNTSAVADGIRVYGIVVAEYCATGGDSGGAITFQGNALGVHKGSVNSQNCSEKAYTGIHPIIRAMDYTIDAF